MEAHVLFDERHRSDSPPATTEGVFEFLDRVNGRYWAAVRDVLNTSVVSDHEEPVIVGDRRLLDDGYWSARRDVGKRVAAVLTAGDSRSLECPPKWSRISGSPLGPNALRCTSPLAMDRGGPTFRRVPGASAEVTMAGLLGLPPDWPPGAPFAHRERPSRARAKHLEP
jgi:hypothetical protein